MTSYIPERGDVVWVNFSPYRGHEQGGHRPAIVISPKTYNEVSSICFVCPITSNTQPWPWKVLLPETSEINGAVLIDQLRTVDRVARKMTFITQAPTSVIETVINRLALLTS